jgi:integrase
LSSSCKGRKRVFLWDTEVRKFGAYRNSTGAVVFVYQFRMHASRSTERLTIGKLGSLTPDQARSIAATAALKVANGINPVEERRQLQKKREVDEALLLKNFALEYLKVRVDEPKLRSAPTVRATIINDICPHLGEVPLANIDVAKTQKMLAQLRLRSPSAARSALVQLKAMLAYARTLGKIDRVAIDILKPEKTKSRSRMLQPREIRRFIEAAHDLGGARGDAFLCILRLVKRVNEVARMEWKELDLDSRTWVLPAERSKNYEPQTILLPSAVVELIERQQPDASARRGFVFSLDGKSPVTLGGKMKDTIDAYMHRRIELAGQAGRPMNAVAPYVIHDLRRAGATTLQRKPFRLPPYVIEALLHHTTGRTPLMKTYQLDEGVEEVADALITWNRYLNELMADQDAWPGGRHLQPLSKEEMTTRTAALRATWPKGAKSEGKSGGSG